VSVRAAEPAGVVIPIRAFAGGMARLAGRLDGGARADLARRCAYSVATAAGAYLTVVVSSAPDVREWARARGLPLIDDPGTLDAAAAGGVAWLAARGCGRAVVAHADLPRARSLDTVAGGGSKPVVTLVPDHREDGTPVLSIPVEAGFRFAYGPGSFRRHQDEARRLGLRVRVVRDADLGFDIDEPDDLEKLLASGTPR
jgi:2-phospho-L-lactate guanylyltransferase